MTHATKPLSVPPSRVAGVRRFNRFYTRKIGVLDEGHLFSPMSLAEVRILYELANTESPTAAGLARDLGIARGSLSRLPAWSQTRGLIERPPAPADRRSNVLRLTPAGRSTFNELN